MQSMWWFIAAAALGIAEVFTLDLTLLMLAGGALAGGGVVLAGGNVVLAAIVAILVSAALMVTLRPYLLRSMRARGEHRDRWPHQASRRGVDGSGGRGC
jgi:membrane protein implicated in regulation of membrane protease activity